MCVQCAAQALEQSAAAGGASGVPALLAAGATAVGANSLGDWLAARNLAWVTQRRVRIVSAGLASAAIVAAVQL